MKKNYQKPSMLVVKMNTHRLLMASDVRGRSTDKYMGFDGDAGDGEYGE